METNGRGVYRLNAKLQLKVESLIFAVPALYEEFDKNIESCIFMSRLGQAYLKTVGIKSKIVESGVSVISWDDNKEINYLGSCGAYDSRLDSTDGVIVPEGDGLKGHLVLILEDRYLLDLTTFQFTRIQHNFKPTPHLLGDGIYKGGSGHPLDLSKSVNSIVRFDFKLPVIFKYETDNYCLEYYLVRETGWLKDVKSGTAWTDDITDCVRFLKKEYKKRLKK